jgi:hypothetical protein
MTIDRRLEEAGRDVRQSFEIVPPPFTPRSKRARHVRRWVPAVAGVAALIVLVFSLSNPNPLPFEVAEGETVLSVDPPVVLGAPSAEPEFDTVELGTAVPLSDVSDLATALDRLAGDSIDAIWDKHTVIGQTENGTIAIIVEGQASCIWVGAPNGDGSCRDILFRTNPLFNSRGNQGSFTWGPVRDGTSVVVVEYGEIRMWQRPTAGHVIFDTNLADGDALTLTALDQEGNVLSVEEQILRR